MWTTTARIGLIALLIGVFSPRALAQDGNAGLVERCIARVGAIVQNTTEANHQIADSTVRSIRVLDHEGAPDRVIIGTGHTGKMAINRRVDVATDRIRSVVGMCIEELRANDAPRRAIAAVIAAGHAAIHAVENSGDRAKARITVAVERATQ